MKHITAASPDRPFGGFVRKIPRIDNPAVPDGDQLNAVAQDDELLQHTIKKRVGIITQY